MERRKIFEAPINHEQEPHCCGCWVFWADDGDFYAQCNECGERRSVIDLLALPAAPGADVADDRCPNCWRKKAHSADDCLDGKCPKWFAVRDSGAEDDCTLFNKAFFSAAPPAGQGATAVAAGAEAVELCGGQAVGGPCILPARHNMGRLDIPSNHRAAQPAHGEPNEWRERVIDKLVVMHIYSEVHDTDPERALNDALAYEVQIALDPLVSSDAQALIDRGINEGLERAAKAVAALDFPTDWLAETQDQVHASARIRCVAAIRSLAAPAKQPEGGFVMVPREPTEEMIAAAAVVDHFGEGQTSEQFAQALEWWGGSDKSMQEYLWGGDLDNIRQHFSSIYKAMLAALPAAAVQERK